MILIPEENLQTRPSVQTPGDPITRLDAEMNQVLTSTEKNDRDKWHQFQQLFTRFLQNLPSKPTNGNVKKEQQESNNVRINKEVILQSVPHIYRNLSGQLLSFLQQLPPTKFHWDATGKVYINGEEIHNSHIVDLINDAVRKRKNIQAEGRQQFISLLKDISIPRTFIGNTDYWKPEPLDVTIADKIQQRQTEGENRNIEEEVINTPLVKRLRKGIREERRKEATKIVVPFDRTLTRNSLKTPWINMELRERKKDKKADLTKNKKKRKAD